MITDWPWIWVSDMFDPDYSVWGVIRFICYWSVVLFGTEYLLNVLVG
jgi:hypothetical protein